MGDIIRESAFSECVPKMSERVEENVPRGKNISFLRRF
jgi:hypothetical protein